MVHRGHILAYLGSTLHLKDAPSHDDSVAPEQRWYDEVDDGEWMLVGPFSNQINLEELANDCERSHPKRGEPLTMPLTQMEYLQMLDVKESL